MQDKNKTKNQLISELEKLRHRNTELKALEVRHRQERKALLEELAQFRALVESTSDFIWEVNHSGIYTYLSPHIKELLGYEPEEIIGKTPFDLMPPDEAERIATAFKAIVEAGKPIERLENVNLHKDGRQVVLETNGVPIIDAGGKLLGYRDFARKREEDKYFTIVHINELIGDALDFTRMRWKDDAESKGVIINIQENLSSVPATTGSGSELREVIVNLINNAIDAMPRGGDIKITTSGEDDHISIRMEDTGAGIPREVRGKIFDPFFTTKGVQSSGLGLSVSYGIINRHRGTISVDSLEGEGTAFTITLPVMERGREEEEKKEKAVEPKHRKAKVLVIEDEEHVRDVLASILNEGGHEVEVTSNGNQGIGMFKENKFDMVFTDLGMPGISGWQVAEKIKSINEKVPVALITGWNIELDESELKKNGVDLVVQKPFEVNQVLRLVQEGMMLRDKFKEA